MTDATLSFADPGRVAFRCKELGINEHRDLEAQLPFLDWSGAYAQGASDAATLLDIGLAIGRWINDQKQWLSRLIQHARAPVIMTIETGANPLPIEKAALETPWELVALERGATQPSTNPYLAFAPNLQLNVVRQLGSTVLPRRSSPYRLSVVFMAAQPDGLSDLAVDEEEAAICRETAGIVDLAIEDSGNLSRLGEMVAQTVDCHVVHVSCHASADPPALALEGERGERVDATAREIRREIGNNPSLMFLSACATAHASDALWTLSADLCRQGWPAVLGWACNVPNSDAITLARVLYRQLALRVPLTEALSEARLALENTLSWHQARLFLCPGGGGQIVGGTSTRNVSHVVHPDAEGYLDPGPRTITVDGFSRPFRYRRALQRVMQSVRRRSHSGVLVHGGSGRERATFVERVLRRMDGTRRVVVTEDFEAKAILTRISNQTGDPNIFGLVRDYLAHVADPNKAPDTNKDMFLACLSKILNGKAARKREGAIALVLHNFEPAPESIPVARMLVRAFVNSTTESSLLLTSAAPFRLVADDGDLADSLLMESLSVQ